MKRLLSHLAKNLVVAGIVGGLILLLPLQPLLGPFHWAQTPLAVLAVVCGLGKLLYDTLFFDRYP